MNAFCREFYGFFYGFCDQSGYEQPMTRLTSSGHHLFILVTGHVKLYTEHDKKTEFFKNWSQNQLVRLVMTRLVTKAT
jgi:hypothetical protein